MAQTATTEDWTAEEASARMRVVSDETRAECEMLQSLPDWSGTRTLARA